jgi:hypothetical protein
MSNKLDGWNFSMSMNWILIISKAKKNKVVDTFNERVHEMHVTAISMYMSNLKGKILGVTNLNQHYL